MYQQRLRVIAGPNGSGKSSLITTLQNKNIDLGQYLNPDLIHQQIKKDKVLSLSQFGLSCSHKSFMDSINKSSFTNAVKRPFEQDKIKICDNVILFDTKAIGSYSTAIVVEFLREELLNKKAKFTIETVFSHSGKIDFISRAHKKSYKIYLYFINTDSVEINKKRIKSRVQDGGHDVPVEKIEKRYKKSVENLFPALSKVYRAYFFDNSGTRLECFAELNPSEKDETKSEITVSKKHLVPAWFDIHVLNKARK